MRSLLLGCLLFWLQIVSAQCGGGSCGKGKTGCDRRNGCCPEEPVKCCDPSCPKCLGGRAPRPGSSCLYGCPLGGCCPGSCPCDDCVCCYTVTALETARSTCYAEDRTIILRTSTKTLTETINLLSTQILPVTFTATESYLFETTSVITEFASEPAIIERTLLTFNLISESTIYFQTISITQLSTTSTAPLTTVTTNAITTVSVFVSQAVSTRTVSTFIPTTIEVGTTRFLTGGYVTFIFGSSFQVTEVVTLAQTFNLDTTLQQAFEFTTRPVQPVTFDETIVATTSIVVAQTTITSNYGTAVPKTVPGTDTFYQYSTPDGIKTEIFTIDGPPVTSTAIQTATVATGTFIKTVTSNICPTISLVQATTVSVQETVAFGTTTILFGTTTIVQVTAETIVLG